MAFVAAVSLPATFAFTSEPVYAAATDGSSALADIEEWFSPSTSLQSIPGGAGAGLGTAGELSGSALEVSGEVAGVAADGAISLTPVGWAIAAGLATAAGGYYAWKSRGAIIGAVNSVWNSLSSSQQSSLEKTNAPGDTVSLPASPIQNYLSTLKVGLPGAAGGWSGSHSAFYKVVLPSSVPQGAKVVLTLSPGAGVPSGGYNWWGNAVWVPYASTTGVSWNDGSGNTGSASRTASGNGLQAYNNQQFDPGPPGDVTITIVGAYPGMPVEYAFGYNSTGNYQDQWVTSNNSPVLLPSDGVLASESWVWSMAAVPGASGAAVPPSEVPPTVSSSAPSFFPGTYQPGTGVEPIGNPAPNPVVAPQASPASLPSGAPSPGFVTFLEDLFVPNPVQIEDALAPLEDAFANRIPFSYVKGTLSLLPMWVDGVGSGGCASFPIPSFGLNNPANPGHSGSSFTASVCPGGFMSGAFSLLKSAFTVILWAFLLGWGVFMFASLMRNG